MLSICWQLYKHNANDVIPILINQFGTVNDNIETVYAGVRDCCL